MSNKSKIWIGKTASTGHGPDYKPGTMEIFRAAITPTDESHGKTYALCSGPFRTIRGAVFMRDFGFLNPHCQCVADAERLAKHYAHKWDKANKKFILYGDILARTK